MKGLPKVPTEWQFMSIGLVLHSPLYQGSVLIMFHMLRNCFRRFSFDTTPSVEHSWRLNGFCCDLPQDLPTGRCPWRPERSSQSSQGTRAMDGYTWCRPTEDAALFRRPTSSTMTDWTDPRSLYLWRDKAHLHVHVRVDETRVVPALCIWTAGWSETASYQWLWVVRIDGARADQCVSK